MRILYEKFHIFHFQKTIVSEESIRGNTVSYFYVRKLPFSKIAQLPEQIFFKLTDMRAKKGSVS